MNFSQYVCLFYAVGRPSWKITHPVPFLSILSQFQFVK